MPAEAAKACRPRRIHEFVARARIRRIHALRYSHAFAAQLTYRDKRPSLKGRENMAPGVSVLGSGSPIPPPQHPQRAECIPAAGRAEPFQLEIRLPLVRVL